MAMTMTTMMSAVVKWSAKLRERWRVEKGMKMKMAKVWRWRGRPFETDWGGRGKRGLCGLA
jgi:hypothetical protein